MFSFDKISVPCLMGIVNVTPDSFSDGGQFLDADAAAAHAHKLVRQGAGIVDLGAEASSFFREGVGAISAEEQLRRLVPVLERLKDLPAVISVDTRSAEVAREVLRRGARIINDISAGTHEPEILRVVGAAGAGIVLMHMSPSFPATPLADDPDIVATVREYLGDRVRAALGAGILLERIAIDPGAGFGKTMADNWRLALRAAEVRPEGFAGPIVLGASRKRFLETAVPGDLENAGWRAPAAVACPHPRDAASAAITVLATDLGVEIHRVHNVQQAIRGFS